MSTLHVELLTKAREMIAVGDETYICIALKSIGLDVGEYRASEEIVNHISTLVGGRCASLATWLQDQGYLGYSPLPADVQDRLRATRLAWIDWLIEEWRDAP